MSPKVVATRLSGEINMFFTRQEFIARWERVSAAMKSRGYDTLLVWQRSAGTYDRIGDVYWLTNFFTNGTGQDPASEDICAPYTFAAVLIRRGREPELHVGLTHEDMALVDFSRVVCGEIVNHQPNLMIGLANYLRTHRIEGRVAIVGDDVLPGMYDRILRRHTPQVEWVSDEGLLLGPQSIKSSRELEAFRTAGEIVTRALTASMEAMISEETGAEAAARAAGIIVRAGGGFHRIDIHHGAGTDKRILSNDLYGYSMTAAQIGDIVRIWIYGPIFEGYWLDPGRSGICGNRPTSEQKLLLEGAVQIVDEVIAGVAPGVTARELGIRGGSVARKAGYFDHAQLNLPLLGHGLGTYFDPRIIPIGESAADPTGFMKYDEPLQAGMVMAAEVFLSHPGVGTAGFEQNFIVTDTGAELLTRTPMLFW
jgi:Xaa-Pro dipeptidase